MLMFFATCSVAERVERFHVVEQRGRVRRTVDAQRFGESPPPNRLVYTPRHGVQPGTPPRQASRCVNDYGVIAVPTWHSYHSEQFGGQLSLSAPDTRPHRSTGFIRVTVRPCGPGGRRLALDHGSV
ncbi:hypothetical protein MSIM_06330 [Mycobacterium simiae]|nr:hypothetical protein MSIM_06330 [Mycobacterium simiae]